MNYDLYQPLNSAKREIRLFEIPHHIPDKEESIRGNLSVFELGRAPPYAALSYVWGNDQDRVPIIVNGKTVDVTRSLEAGLAAWKRLATMSYDSNYIWADAICINQIDAAEKSAQVSFMTEIYRSGYSTFAHFAHDPPAYHIACGTLREFFRPYLQFALEEFPAFRDSRTQFWDHAFDDRWSILDPISIGLDSSTDVPIMPIQALMADPWWTRLWTLQEGALSKSCFIMFDKDLVPSAELQHLLKMLLVKSLRVRRLSRDNGLEQGLITLSGQISAIILDNDLTRYPAPSLLIVLEKVAMSKRKCSDPRDRFFGIKGLVDKNCEAMQDLRHMSYKHNLTEVYTVVARTLFKIHGIQMLNYCGHPKSAERQHSMHFEAAQLPSWVPQWETMANDFGLQGPLTMRQRQHLNASKGLCNPNYDIFSVEEYHLRAGGAEIDSIKYTTWLQHGEWQARDWVGWVMYVVILFAQIRPRPTLEPIVLAIIMTCTAETVAILPTLGDEEMTPQAKMSLLRGTLEMMRSPPSEVVSHKVLSDQKGFFMKFGMIHELQWQLFITQRGYLGLGRRHCAPGDVVCILAGATTGSILRPANSENEDQKYKYVSEAYINGMMHGEFVPEPSAYKTFTIV